MDGQAGKQAASEHQYLDEVSSGPELAGQGRSRNGSGRHHGQSIGAVVALERVDVLYDRGKMAGGGRLT